MPLYKYQTRQLMLFQDLIKGEFVIDHFGGFPAISGIKRGNFIRNTDPFRNIGVKI